MKTFNNRKKISIYSFSLIPIFVWIGFVCSISFMEAWLKFRAPHVTLPVGLSIGRLIFASLNKVEWGFAVLIAFFILMNKRRPKLKKMIFFFIPIAILVLQTSWLLPSLSERAENIIQGRAVSSTYVHFYYIFLELVKVASLFIWGINMIYSLDSSGKRKAIEKP